MTKFVFGSHPVETPTTTTLFDPISLLSRNKQVRIGRKWRTATTTTTTSTKPNPGLGSGSINRWEKSSEAGSGFPRGRESSGRRKVPWKSAAAAAGRAEGDRAAGEPSRVRLPALRGEDSSPFPGKEIPLEADDERISSQRYFGAKNKEKNRSQGPNSTWFKFLQNFSRFFCLGR